MKKYTTSRIFIVSFLILIAGLPKAVSAQANEVSIAAVGDINLGGRVQNFIRQKGLFYPIARLKPLLTSTDITFGNLECALSSRGQPVAGKEFTFCGQPENVKTLKAGGFDIVSVANNHSKDFGETAFLDTLETLEASRVRFVGGGKNLQAAVNPVIIKKSGLNIAFLAFSGILPYGWSATDIKPGVASLRNATLVKEKIRVAKSKADLVIVSLHWGVELQSQPLKEQKELARQLIDVGATAIIGHHPHVLQPIEVYKNGLIAYSLGNFIFTPGSPAGSKSALLHLKLDKYGLSSFKVWPVKITSAQPAVASGKTAQEIRSFLRKQFNLEPGRLNSTGEALSFYTFRYQKKTVFKKLARSYFIF